VNQPDLETNHSPLSTAEVMSSNPRTSSVNDGCIPEQTFILRKTEFPERNIIILFFLVQFLCDFLISYSLTIRYP
jgi:hypothetical protein